MTTGTGRQGVPEGVDPQRPSASRVYDYLLGGTHNFAADRRAAEQILAVMPQLPAVMRANRRFLTRAVRAVAAGGVDQFLDLGSGIPTEGNVHEIARQVRPGAAVVYVDIDPIAVTHSRAILDGDPRAHVVQAEVTDVPAVLGDPGLRALIDFTRPVCLLMVAVAHFIPDTERLTRALQAYRDALPSGSYLVASHGTAEGDPEKAEELKQVYNRTTSPLVARSREEFARLLEGWDLIEPGLANSGHWRPEPGDPPADSIEARTVLVAVGRKP